MHQWHAGAWLSQKTRAINDVGSAFVDRSDQLGIFGGALLQFCILYDHNLPARLFETTSQSRSFSIVFLLKKDSEKSQILQTVHSRSKRSGRLVLRSMVLVCTVLMIRQLSKHLSSAICRTVIHDDDFFIDVDAANLQQDFFNGCSLVVNRHHHREVRTSRRVEHGASIWNIKADRFRF